MKLFCGTSDSRGYCEWASTEITPAQARKLIDTYRPLFDHAKTVNSLLYCLEFYDSINWANTTNADTDRADFDNTQWYAVGDKVEVGSDDDLRNPRVAAETMKVTSGGILWSASPKHSDGYFETPELSWDDLEQITLGKNPFTTIVETQDDGPPFADEPSDDHPDEDESDPPEPGEGWDSSESAFPI